jgi:hypothetical protein
VSTKRQTKVRRHHSRKHETARTIAGLASVVAVVAGLIYLGYAGRTDRWPEAQQCTIVAKRTVHTIIGDSANFRHPIVAWQGEYRIDYVVNGKDYFAWASAGLLDPDRSFVENKMADLETECPLSVQYNPANPAQSVTHLRRP